MQRRKIWVVGHILEGKNAWALVGIFTSEARALENVMDKKEFIGPCYLDEIVTPWDLLGHWPGAYYPLTGSPCKKVESYDRSQS